MLRGDYMHPRIAELWFGVSQVAFSLRNARTDHRDAGDFETERAGRTTCTHGKADRWFDSPDGGCFSLRTPRPAPRRCATGEWTFEDGEVFDERESGDGFKRLAGLYHARLAVTMSAPCTGAWCR